MRSFLTVAVLATIMVLGSAGAADAAKARTDIYGYVMMDAGYNSIGIDPAWFDVQRPTKLPAFENQHGEDGSTFFSVRQTRFGVKSYLPTDMGEMKTTFEWEMFGVGADAGQTTIRLRHAYGELGKFGAGQTWSPFMDIDIFPNTLEYWGPNGMVFFRNVQVRWMPIQGDTRLTVALERPGASADAGSYSGRVELADVAPRFPFPDLSAEYRVGRPWGYVELSGIVRRMEWEDLGTDSIDVGGEATGWGIHLSSNLKPTKNDVLRLSVVHGEGVQNYMNDAPADVGVEISSSGGIDGEAIPVTGIVAFLDHTWNAKYSSSIGYSQVDIDNTNGQSPSAFKKGQYFLANLLYTPVPKVMMGVEGGWIHRDNFSDGFSEDDAHVQVSFKYSFDTSIGGGE